MLGTRINIHRRQHLKKSTWGGQIMHDFFSYFLSPKCPICLHWWSYLEWNEWPPKWRMFSVEAVHQKADAFEPHLHPTPQILHISSCKSPDVCPTLLPCRCFSFVLVTVSRSPSSLLSVWYRTMASWLHLFQQPQPLTLGRRLALGRTDNPPPKRKKY